MRDSRQEPSDLCRTLISWWMNPFGVAVGPVFFLPDRDDLFNAVHDPLPGFKGSGAMGAAGGDTDGDVAEIEVPQPVNDCGADDRPAGLGFVEEGAELPQGHLGVRLVIEGRGLFAVGHLTNRAEKQHDRPRLMRPHALDEHSRVDRHEGQFEIAGVFRHGVFDGAFGEDYRSLPRLQ